MCKKVLCTCYAKISFSLDVATNMNKRTHLDDFTCGRIVCKLESRSVRDIANEFGTAKSVIEWLWKRFYETGIGTKCYSFANQLKLL